MTGSLTLHASLMLLFVVSNIIGTVLSHKEGKQDLGLTFIITSSLPIIAAYFVKGQSVISYLILTVILIVVFIDAKRTHTRIKK